MILLQKLKIKNEQKEIIEMVPESLKFFFLAENLNKKQCNFIRGFFLNESMSNKRNQY